MYHLCQYESDTASATCKHNNINTDALAQTAATVEYIQGGPKRTVFPHDAMHARHMLWPGFRPITQTTPHDSPETLVF